MFVQQDKLVARRIDAERGELSGNAVTVAEPVRTTFALPWLSVSATGVVAYRSGSMAPRRSTWFDRAGKVLSVGDDLNAPALSPDQRVVAYDPTDGSNRDDWIMDLVRGSHAPLTRHPAMDGHPVWSPDGSEIAFESQRDKQFDIWKKPSSGRSAEEPFRAMDDFSSSTVRSSGRRRRRSRCS